MAIELGSAAIYVHCDVTQEDQVAGLVDAAVENFGKLDVMYNNAGVVGALGPIATTPAEEWNRTIDIHVNGCFYGCKHAARVMIPRERGSIVSMSSTAGINGGLGPHAYTAAKHAIVGITKSWLASSHSTESELIAYRRLGWLRQWSQQPSEIIPTFKLLERL